MELAGLYIYSYLIGSLPTAYIIGRLVKGIDIRRFGSGNVGGTNVFYNVGRRWVVPLGFFEFFVKGGSAVWIGMFAMDLESSSFQLMGAPLLTLAANNWSPWLKLTGGRGMAMALGTLLALAYKDLIVFAAVAIGGWAIFRSSGVWAYIALILLPLWSLLVFQEPLAVTMYCVGLVALVTVKRLTSNWNPLPDGVPRREVFLNRLVRDRDLARREDWLDRSPTGTDERTG